MKKLCALLLVFALLVSTLSAAAGFDGFSKQKTYTDGIFTDIAQGDWFYDNVRAIYEYGLMIGTTESRFSPHSSVTVAEAVTISARLHKLYYFGNDSFAASSPWYQTYADYAYWASLLYPNYSDYQEALASGAAINRNNFIFLLSQAMPEAVLKPINEVEFGSIIDLWSYLSYDHIYQFYRAGILAGKNSHETFFPTATLSRSEAAAIVTRILDPSLRMEFTLTCRAFDRTAWYGAGSYQVGADIPRGMYYVIPSGGEASWTIARYDSSGSLTTIASNAGIQSYDFIAGHTGEYFHMTGGRFILAENIAPLPISNGHYGDGKYRIGVDIPAGRYQIYPNAEGKSANYVVFDGARGHKQGGLLDMSSVLDFYIWDSGPRDVTLPAGAVLALSDCYISISP